MVRLALVLAQLPNLPNDRFKTDPAPYITLFGIGFLRLVLGHILKVRLMVAIGVLMVFAATVLLPIFAHLQY